MRKFFTQIHLLLIVMLTCSAVGFGQTTVFSDDFNRAALSPGGTPANTYTSTLVPNVTATTGTFLRVGSGATGPVNGISYVSGNNAAFAAPYNTLLGGNNGTVTWTFNLRWNRASGNNPAAPASGAYSTVAVLAGTSPALTTGNGYAIVYGNSLAPDPIRLVAYTGGVTGALTPICTSGISDLALTNNYVSVKVVFDAATGAWSLYLRDDGTTAWSDPSSGVTAQKGTTTVNNTYTGVNLPAFGFMWTHATGVNMSSDFDNYKVVVTPPVSPAITTISPTAATAGGGAFTLTVNGTDFVNGLSKVTWNGVNKATAFVSATQLTAVIPAGDISTAGTALVGVTTTGAPASSGTISFTINAPATPFLTVTAPLGGFGNVCINTVSVPKSFTLEGNSLDGTNINIAASPGFVYSETPGGTYTNTLQLSYTGGTLSARQVYVKFSPTAVQPYNENITVSGGGIGGIPVTPAAAGVNTAPTVVTGNAIVAGTSGILNGSITLTGCTPVSAYGFEYSNAPGFGNGTGLQVTAVNLNSGAFSKTVSGLPAGSTYYYKAYAVNDAGISYGAENSFTTSFVVPVVMADQPLLRYSENFNDLSHWTDNFTAGIGANHFSAVIPGGSAVIPNATRITTSTAAFSSSTSGGVQKGSGAIILLSTSSTDNTTSAAIDFYMDFSGMNAGTLSFDWASIDNSLTAGSNRNGSLRVYASNDGVSFTELTAADVINFTNGVPSTGTVNSIALPAFFNNSPTARLRFYYHNGTGGSSGSRPKISIDNLAVTGVASSPCVTPASGPSSLTFGTTTETTIQGNFVASSPAVNEYLVVMSTSSSLTSNPIDGQSYTIGDNLGDGTVIAKGSELNFTATGLTGATTYYFFVFPVNSVCTGGPLYSSVNVLTEEATTVAGLPACAAPTVQPANLVTGVVTTQSVQASFTAGNGDESLVLQSANPVLSVMPVNGHVYNAGEIVGNASVVQRGNNNSFASNGLSPNTAYYYFVFAVNSQGCVNGPVYNAAAPLSGSVSTLPLSPCATPQSQPANIAFNSSNSVITGTFNAVSGASYNYLVVRSLSSTLSALPADNTDYVAGDNLGGGTVIGNSASSSFNTSNLAASTAYYFFVFSADKNCTGGTKYLVTSPLTGNTSTTSTPAYNYYFGTLHSHSDYSDGNKDHPGYKPADGYAYALGSHGMDFLGISEHNHFSSLDNPGNELYKYRLGISQADSFTAAHPNFLALYGMEWGVISGGGHVVVYGDNMNDLFGWESNVNGTTGPNYDVYVPKSTYTGTTGLFKTINDFVAKNTFATLAHPNNTDYNNLSNSPYDAQADAAIAGTAVESGPATSTNMNYTNPGASMFYLWYYQKMLSKGYHLGPTIDHDNHNTTFGRTTNARTAVLAPALNKNELMKAMRDMHFYATEDYDTKVDFTINTRIMGSIFEDRNAPAISVNISDATTNTSNAVIRIMYGIPGSNVFPVQVDSAIGSSLNFVDNNLPNHATGYYYADITNGTNRTVTSPIWYTRTCAASSDTTAAVCDNFNWYGTVYTSSAIASKTFVTTGGCDSTVTLHLTIHYSPASATIAAAGPVAVCPGTAVVFTATANEGSNGAISGYQWLQNGVAIPGAITDHFTATQTGTYSVKALNGSGCFAMSGVLSATVSDAIAPVPDAETLPAVSGDCSVTLVAPTATDNCTGTITGTTATLVFTQQGTHTVTWTYADGNGNSTTQIQAVIVQDLQKPTVTAPAAINVTNEAGQCSATITDLGTPVATDNCGVASISNDHSSPVFPVGTTIVTWTVTDINGNVSDPVQQSVTVTDNELPTITVQAVNANNTPGSCEATIMLADPVTNDNCGVATVTNDHPSNAYPVGMTQVTWTVTDIHGLTNTTIQTVTVADTENPVVIPRNVSVTLGANGQVSITAAQVNNGSNDACGVASIGVSPSSFTCANIGPNQVMLTVTDVHGNTATGIAIVMVLGVIPQGVITVVPANNTYTGGVPSNLYLGYGPQSVTLAVTASGGAPYNYSWSGNGALINASGASPVFAPTAAGLYTFTVHITNANGCTVSSQVSVCVTDIRVPGSNGKVYVTDGKGNKAKTLSISTNAVPAHLNHEGSRLGRVDQEPCSNLAANAITGKAVPTVTKEQGMGVENNELVVKVSPNPSTRYFILKLESRNRAAVTLRVLDASGRVVDARSGISANSSLQIGHTYQTGTYYAELMQGTQRKVVQLIKVAN